eukprot:m.12634 g.12634  ORF g.12634 m.12634 type:complete len:402 (-) comp2965_c0_seq2:261-1466(-)
MRQAPWWLCVVDLLCMGTSIAHGLSHREHRAVNRMTIDEAAPVTWTQLGQTVSQTNVVAVTITTDARTNEPVFAFGWEDAEHGTRVRVMQWNPVTTTWEVDFDRTSQFPQHYNEFDIKARGSRHYLALRISGKYGSVLNSGAHWAGCYAFHNGLVDFEIMADGDMIMLWHSLAPTNFDYPGTNGSLAFVRYAADGWSSYPATNTYGPLVDIARDDGNHAITGARLVFRKAADGYVSTNLVGAYSQGGTITVVATVHGMEAPSVIGTFPGDTVGLDANDQGHVCVAYHRGDAAVHVSCLGPESTTWTHLGMAIAGSSHGQKVRPEIVVTRTHVHALGRADAAGDTILAGRHALVDTHGAGWRQTPFVADAIVSDYQTATDGTTVYLAVVEKSGQGLRVVTTD